MQTDSGEYQILTDSVIAVKDIPGLTCEIGVREGGSTKHILDTLRQTGQQKVHIAIDPYGNIDYRSWEDRVDKLDYTNSMKNKMLINLYTYCDEYKMDCLYFPLEDTEFFKRYSDGVPIYNENKQIVNQYSLVFLDGPHTSSDVIREFDFFKNRMPSGGRIVCDDYFQYNHMQTVDPHFTQNGFILISKGEHKLSYQKM